MRAWAAPSLHAVLMACFAFAATAFTAQADDRLDLELGRYGPAITIRIGAPDGRVFNVLLDTGAAISVFNATAAEGLDMDLLQAVNVGSNTGARTQAGIYRTGPLIVGERWQADVQVLAIDLAAQGGPFIDGISGILSPAVFSPFLVELDFPAGTLRLLDRSDRPEGVPSRYAESGLPAVQVSIAGHDYTALVDTGASAFLTLPSALADDLPLAATPEQSGTIRTVNDSVSVSTATLNGGVRIAGHLFDQPELDFVDSAESILVGMDALRQFVIVLDPAHGEAWLLPRAPADE